MERDFWPAVTSDRFDGETERDHAQRVRRIAELMEDFRMSRFDPATAEQMERKLIALQETASPVG